MSMVLQANGPNIVNGNYFQFVLTRDNNNLISAYIDGDLQFSFTDNNLTTAMCATDNFYFFVDDLATNTESPQGAVARITVMCYFFRRLSLNDQSS